MPRTLEQRAHLLPSQLHCYLSSAEQGGSAAWLPFRALMGVSHMLMGIPLKWTFLRLSLFHIPAFSHAVHLSRCSNFTLHRSGISSSSQSLRWPLYNLHLWILHPSTVLFVHCECLRTKDQPSFNHVNSSFSSLLLIQFPLPFSPSHL